MSCLYSRICVLTQRAPLNAEISRGFQVPWRSRSSLRNATEREKETRGNKNIRAVGEQKCRTATTTGVIARGRHGPRENASGPPNNSPRTTRDVYVSRRRDARVRLAAAGTAGAREFISLLFSSRENKTIPRMPKREDPARSENREESRKTSHYESRRSQRRRDMAIMKMRAFFMCFKKISITLSDLGKRENTEKLF